MDGKVKNLFSPHKTHSYRTLNLIEINHQALKQNFAFFQSQNPEAKVCPVLKSNAYGHGLKLIGKFVDWDIKPEFICVDSLYEAYELKKCGVKTPILILGYTFPENFMYKKIDFRLPLFDRETLKILSFYQPGIKVHLKVDTGMNRLGIKEADVDNFIIQIKKHPAVIIEGIYSHLADADNCKSAKFSELQIKNFKKIISRFESAGFQFKYKHINATAGSLRFPDSDFNLTRLGIGFYGISPFPINFPDAAKLGNELKPALKLITHIAEIKTVEKAETISYGRTFRTKKTMKIAILPLGYYDGLDRRLSNKGVIKIDNQYCPIVGRVCMNITVIDVSAVKKPYVGQEAVVYDDNNKSLCTIKNTAELIGTIPYEILVKLSETTRRMLK